MRGQFICIDEVKGELIDDRAMKRFNEAEAKIFTDTVLTYLNEEERCCLKKRFLEDEDLEWIGMDLGLTREKVRQVVERALCRIRERIKENEV